MSPETYTFTPVESASPEAEGNEFEGVVQSYIDLLHKQDDRYLLGDKEMREQYDREMRASAQTVLAHGHPILLTTLLMAVQNPDLEFNLAYFVDALAEPSDLSLLVSRLEVYLQHTQDDLSVPHHYLRTIARLIALVRLSDNDPDYLTSFVERLIPLITPLLGNEYSREEVLQPLANSGTKLAKDFITARAAILYPQALARLVARCDDDSALLDFDLQPYHFQTEEEYQAVQAKKKENDRAFDHERATITSRIDLPSPAERQRIHKQVTDLLAVNPDLVSHAESAACLNACVHTKLYNFFSEHATYSPEELQRQVDQLRSLTDREEEFSSLENYLPSIGVELEIPLEHLHPDEIDNLTPLGIPHYYENDRVYELSLPFSFSGGLQAQLLHEATKLLMRPYQKLNLSQEEVIGEGGVFPLHVNLSTPYGITREMLEGPYQEDLELFSVVVNTAHTSPKRLEGHEYTLPYQLKDKGDSVLNSRNMEYNSFFFMDDLTDVGRWELRAPEHRGRTTYRMLPEIQWVASMLYSFIQEREQIPGFTAARLELSELYLGFRQEAVELASYQYGHYEIGDDTFSDPEFVERAYSLMHRYGQAARKIILVEKAATPSD